MKLYNNVIGTLLSTVLILSCTAQDKTALAAEEFQQGIKQKQVQILDVRTRGEFASGHIEQALQADWNDKKEFEHRISFMDKKKPVYVYCLAGGRSAAAAARMRQLGFENVFELKGGTNAWRATNKPLTGVNTEKQMTLEEFNATVQGSETVLVDFGAPWCPPCRQMEPVIQQLQEKKNGQFTLLKVDGGRDQDIVQQYKVTALPVFIVFKNGKEVWRKDGVATESELSAKLD